MRRRFADLIKNEHPQIIATILVPPDHDQASDILNQFLNACAMTSFFAFATLEGIQPGALEGLNEVMLRILSGSANIKKAAMGGVRPVADSQFHGSANGDIGRRRDPRIRPDLAQKILDEMFVFREPQRPRRSLGPVAAAINPIR